MFCSSGTPPVESEMPGVTEHQLKTVEEKFTKILLRNETQLEKNVSDVDALSKKVDILLEGIKKAEEVIEQSQLLLTTHQNEVHEKLGIVGANVQNFIDDAQNEVVELDDRVQKVEKMSLFMNPCQYLLILCSVATWSITVMQSWNYVLRKN